MSLHGGHVNARELLRSANSCYCLLMLVGQSSRTPPVGEKPPTQGGCSARSKAFLRKWRYMPGLDPTCPYTVSGMEIVEPARVEGARKSRTWGFALQRPSAGCWRPETVFWPKRAPWSTRPGSKRSGMASFGCTLRDRHRSWLPSKRRGQAFFYPGADIRARSRPGAQEREKPATDVSPSETEPLPVGPSPAGTGGAYRRTPHSRQRQAPFSPTANYPHGASDAAHQAQHPRPRLGWGRPARHVRLRRRRPLSCRQ